jgi:predicted DNA-binding transcriptional regulator AlpA
MNKKEMDFYKFENFSNLPPDALVNMTVLILLFDLSESTIRREIKKGNIPESEAKISERSAKWRVDKIRKSLK